MTEELRETALRIILHPVAAITALFAMAAQAFSIPLVDALVLTVWSKIGSIFTVLSITSTQFDGPVLGFIPIAYIQVGATIAGVLFALSILDRIFGDFISNLRSEKAEEEN